MRGRGSTIVGRRLGSPEIVSYGGWPSLHPKRSKEMRKWSWEGVYFEKQQEQPNPPCTAAVRRRRSPRPPEKCNGNEGKGSWSEADRLNKSNTKLPHLILKRFMEGWRWIYEENGKGEEVRKGGRMGWRRGEGASDFMLKGEEDHIWFSGNGVVLYNVKQ